MNDEKISKFYRVTLDEALKRLRKANPKLATIIEEISPNKEFRLYCGEYPFGENFVQQGKFYIPIEGRLLNLAHPDMPTQYVKDLSYNVGTNPTSVILENSLEVYMSHRVTKVPVTIATVHEGGVISVARVLARSIPHQPAFLWNLSAGARSLFLLPKISQKRKYRSLRSSLGIDTEIPKNTLEHIHIFKKIFAHDCIKPWNTKILFFAKKWFEHLEDPAWIKFKVYLLECLRNSFEPLGSMSIWDMVISLILKEKDIRPNLYIINTVKHLLMIAAGIIPGIAPAIDEKSGPISELQKIFSEYYKIDYIPTILSPTYLNMYSSTSQPILYSLQHPNLLEDAPRKKDNSSLISETYDVASLLEKVLSSLKHSDYNLQETPLYDIPRRTSIEAFHPEPSEYSKIKTSKVITAEDSRFTKTLHKCTQTEIAENSSIFKGCFRLKSLKNSELS